MIPGDRRRWDGVGQHIFRASYQALGFVVRLSFVLVGEITEFSAGNAKDTRLLEPQIVVERRIYVVNPALSLEMLQICL